MNRFYNETLYKLETAIRELESETDSSIQQIESNIHIIFNYLSQVKEYIIKTEFRDSDEEIYFFKHIKPKLVAKLIYYNAIYKIEAKKPYGGKQIVEDYLNKELLRLKSFYDRNIEFCKYYRTNSTYLDHKYFVRGQYNIKLSLDTFAFEADTRFSTSHDYKVAKIIANDRIQVYLEDQLHNCQNRKSSANSPLNWTGTKVAATELIYALHSQGVFNNGNTDIIEVKHIAHLKLNVKKT